MGNVTEYAGTPIISTRGLNRWDAQQGVGVLVVRPGVRLEVSRCWLKGEPFARLQLWTQADPRTPGNWQPAGPEFALPSACIADVARLLTAVTEGQDHATTEEGHGD